MQAEEIAAVAGQLAEGLPDAIRRAVRHNKVPRELHEDLWRLADRLQPLAVAIRRNAAKLHQLATRAALATEQTAEAGAEVSTSLRLAEKNIATKCYTGMFMCWALRGCGRRYTWIWIYLDMSPPTCRYTRVLVVSVTHSATAS